MFSTLSVRKIFNLILFLCLFLLPGSGWAEPHELEKIFIRAGLVDVQTIAPSVRVDLVNADSSKNFFGKDFYKGLGKAYLRQEVALKLKKAQALLSVRHPGYSLLILDAARPRRVSRIMYETMKGTRFERYVANPDKGSMHNYGIAVDITLTDASGKRLDMGYSPFFKTRLQLYGSYAKKKLGFDLTEKQRHNRSVLGQVMTEAGFIPLPFEWWHFNGMPKDQTRKTYRIIE